MVTKRDTRTECGFCKRVCQTRAAAVACYDSHARIVEGNRSTKHSALSRYYSASSRGSIR